MDGKHDDGRPARPDAVDLHTCQSLSGHFRDLVSLDGRSWRHWIGGFAEVGEQLTQPSANGRVGFDLAWPPTRDGIVDELLFTDEPSSQSRGIFTGGEELGAPEV